MLAKLRAARNPVGVQKRPLLTGVFYVHDTITVREPMLLKVQTSIAFATRATETMF